MRISMNMIISFHFPLLLLFPRLLKSLDHPPFPPFESEQDCINLTTTFLLPRNCGFYSITIPIMVWLQSCQLNPLNISPVNTSLRYFSRRYVPSYIIKQDFRHSTIIVPLSETPCFQCIYTPLITFSWHQYHALNVCWGCEKDSRKAWLGLGVVCFCFSKFASIIILSKSDSNNWACTTRYFSYSVSA